MMAQELYNLRVLGLRLPRRAGRDNVYNLEVRVFLLILILGLWCVDGGSLELNHTGQLTQVRLGTFSVITYNRIKEHFVILDDIHSSYQSLLEVNFVASDLQESLLGLGL